MATAEEEFRANFVVVGGGIAGVSCAEQLSLLNPDSNIIILTASKMIKAVTNFQKISRALETFDVTETSATHLTQLCPNVRVIQGTINSINTTNNLINSASGIIHYNKLCLCVGASPNLVIKENPLIIGIRDTGSVKELQEKVKNSQRIIVLGNGGIATELIYELKGCHVIWAIKDSSIGSTFFDEGAAKFFLARLNKSHPNMVDDVTRSKSRVEKKLKEVDNDTLVKTKPLKRMKYMLDPIGSGDDDLGGLVYGDNSRTLGSALGPDWSEGLDICGKSANNQDTHSIQVEYNCQLDSILTSTEYQLSNLKETSIPEQKNECLWPLYVKLSNGKLFGCDLIISATGVVPNTKGYLNDQLTVADDGGIMVDDIMRTTCDNVYAAGDVCTVNWPNNSTLWFQMRLWSQARQMGSYAAKCMTSHTLGEDISLDFCFELFAHVTKFFGYKVVLLGRYNSQGLGNNFEILLRVTEGVEYIKVILRDGRMVGAILIGDTDLEETFENLILNQLDLTQYGEHLLDPDIDIEDYFD